MEPSQRLPELFSRYVRNEATSEEVQELVMLLGQADAEGLLSGPMRGLWEQLKSRPVAHSVDWDSMYRRMNQREEELLGLQQRKGGAFLHAAGLRMGQDVAEGYGKRRPIGINGIGEEEDGEGRWTGVWVMRVIVICLLAMAAAAAYFSIKMAEGKAAEHGVMKVVK
jgi:hypothetical protein